MSFIFLFPLRLPEKYVCISTAVRLLTGRDNPARGAGKRECPGWKKQGEMRQSLLGLEQYDHVFDRTRRLFDASIRPMGRTGEPNLANSSFL